LLQYLLNFSSSLLRIILNISITSIAYLCDGVILIYSFIIFHILDVLSNGIISVFTPDAIISVYNYLIIIK